MALTFTPRLCLRGALKVTLSAVASFVAAILSRHTTPPELLAMFCGVATFIAIHILLEAWSVSNGYAEFQRSLNRAVKIKIWLQLIPAIEVGAGAMASWLIERGHPTGGFISAYLMTIAVGVELTIVVFLITAIHWYFAHRLGHLPRQSSRRA